MRWDQHTLRAKVFHYVTCSFRGLVRLWPTMTDRVYVNHGYDDERIGDHVTYLGELVVAMVRGEDICHGAKSGGSMRAVPYHERN